MTIMKVVKVKKWFNAEEDENYVEEILVLSRKKLRRC